MSAPANAQLLASSIEIPAGYILDTRTWSVVYRQVINGKRKENDMERLYQHGRLVLEALPSGPLHGCVAMSSNNSCVPARPLSCLVPNERTANPAARRSMAAASDSTVWPPRACPLTRAA